MQNHTIRKAVEEDTDSWRLCIDNAYARYNSIIDDLPDVSEGCEEDIANKRVWLAVDGDIILGGVVLVASDDHLKLANLAVHPDHCGKGIGKSLIRFSEEETLRQGFRLLNLNTHAGMPGNIALYLHLGWRETARLENTVSMSK